MKFDILNRVSEKVLFTADIDCDKLAPEGFKIGLAVRWAVKNGADLRGANLSGADLRGVDLRGLNLSGSDLSWANLSVADLRGVDLRGVDLRGVDLRGVDLRGVDLRGVNLRGANLSGVDLSGIDLSGVDLRGVDLRGVDLRGVDLSVVGWIPKIENIHTAVYAAASKDNALDMGDWPKCDSTHCRAGWVVILAGEAGKVMEDLYGTGVAAALIYMASDPTMESIPNWLASSETALKDMKEMAEAEQRP
ncbi:MAG: pentapeptide repeat-containing protein [Robiginitomaculum sp.]|nr:pentapeptide repeat-containing protein [Robiginitomaculum sp.]